MKAYNKTVPKAKPSLVKAIKPEAVKPTATKPAVKPKSAITKQDADTSIISCECGANTFWFLGDHVRCISCKNEYKKSNIVLWMRRLNLQTNSYGDNWECAHKLKILSISLARLNRSQQDIIAQLRFSVEIDKDGEHIIDPNDVRKVRCGLFKSKWVISDPVLDITVPEHLINKVEIVPRRG